MDDNAFEQLSREFTEYFKHAPREIRLRQWTCWVCRAPLDPEGRCTRVNDFQHTDTASDYPEWMDLFHFPSQMENAPPLTFLIDGFLQTEGVTAIAAPVRERKTIIALNVVHSLLTGDDLFGHFKVMSMPRRVIYLSPENGIGTFSGRLRKLGLLPYLKPQPVECGCSDPDCWPFEPQLFVRTMNSEGQLKLNDPALLDAMPGAVVVLDTAVRFLEGDESSSNDVRVFAALMFEMLKRGALSVIMLHHSSKEAANGALTLENALRGSGDMGGFLCSCWGTRMLEAGNYDSPSYFKNLKPRDFESPDFNATCDRETLLMRYVDGPPVSNRSRGNRDLKDADALAIVKAHLGSTIAETVKALADAGIKRGPTTVHRMRAKVKLAE